jgi:hypothetical protein
LKSLDDDIADAICSKPQRVPTFSTLHVRMLDVDTDCHVTLAGSKKTRLDLRVMEGRRELVALRKMNVE